MEKRMWTKPEAIAEQFMPNEYMAACGDSGTVYKFVCDAKGGTLYYYPSLNAAAAQPGSWPTTTEERGPFWDPEEVTVTAATLLGYGYHPCDESHEASSQNPFYWGFVDYNSNELHDATETVIVWRGERNNNGHATQSLDMTKWETAKS